MTSSLWVFFCLFSDFAGKESKLMYDTSDLIYIFRPNSCRGNKVCVVAILGKSRYNAFTSKASIFNPILDADVFQVRVYQQIS